MNRNGLTIPERADPFVREFFRIAQQENAQLLDVAEKSGLSRKTIDGWRRHSEPKAAHLEACLNVLGYRLAVVPLEQEAAE